MSFVKVSSRFEPNPHGFGIVCSFPVDFVSQVPFRFWVVIYSAASKFAHHLGLLVHFAVERATHFLNVLTLKFLTLNEINRVERNSANTIMESSISAISFDNARDAVNKGAIFVPAGTSRC